MSKNMRIEHKSHEANGTRFEVNNIYAPGASLIPIHTFDREYPISHGSELECAIQSLTFADVMADKFKKKYGATGKKFYSSVVGAAELYMAANK